MTPTGCCCLPSGFYLISPSEFERFSLSARYLVEPRCLVEVPLRSGSSNQHRPDGASSALRYVNSELLYIPLDLHDFFQYSFGFSVPLEMPGKTVRMQVNYSETLLSLNTSIICKHACAVG